MLLLLFRPYGAGVQPPVVVDTYVDDKHDRKYRKRREELRAELETAFNSEYGIVAEQELSEFIAPQVTDSVARPAMERVDFDLAWSRYEEVVDRLARIRARLAEEDEEDSILLLS